MRTADEAVGQPALVVKSDKPDRWLVSSSPLALVKVELFRRGDLWYYVVVSEILRGAVKVAEPKRTWGIVDEEAYFHAALQVAGDHVTRVARYKWASHFTPRQRYAMGQQKCPYPMKETYCGITPMVGSVWCEWHRFGKAVGR